MRDKDLNKDNAWLKFLATGELPPPALSPVPGKGAKKRPVSTAQQRALARAARR